MVIKRLSTYFFNAVLVIAQVQLYVQPNIALANPAGGEVASGEVTITQPNNNTLEINQSSNKGIINWQSFNIQAGEHTQFIQPSASAITLNRINSSNGASSILGNLTANGQVWLINPAGILFGPGANVNVGGILATTSNIKDADFLNGNYQFNSDSNQSIGSIINQGTINAHPGGLVALIGNSVDNQGLIQARLGTVVLGGASTYTLDFDGDQLINFVVQKGPANENSSVKNSGTINVSPSSVVMNTQAAQHLVQHAINLKGYTEANHVHVRGGVVVLEAGSGSVSVSNKVMAKGGKVTVHGSTANLNNATINTSGYHPGSITITGDKAVTINNSQLLANSATKGGSINLLGSNTIALSNSTVQANGAQGGGQILVGGNQHGDGPEPNALFTSADSNTLLEANALQEGNGGRVILWSDNSTAFYGRINATGGALRGNGGFVETSGVNGLALMGAQINTLAPHGAIGTWLLDPYNLIIDAGGSDYSILSSNPSGDVTIDPATFNDSSSNVVLQADNNITIKSPINLSTEGVSLTANAGGDIYVLSNITTTGPGSSVTLNASNSLATGVSSNNLGLYILTAGGNFYNAGDASNSIPTFPTGVSSNNLGLYILTAGGNFYNAGDASNSIPTLATGVSSNNLGLYTLTAGANFINAGDASNSIPTLATGASSGVVNFNTTGGNTSLPTSNSFKGGGVLNNQGNYPVNYIYSSKSVLLAGPYASGSCSNPWGLFCP